MRRKRGEKAPAKKKRSRKKSPEMRVISETVGEEITEGFLDDEPKRTANRLSVREKKVAALELVTLRPDAKAWKAKTLKGLAQKEFVAGSFWRLQPPHDVTDDRIDQVKRALEKAGAAVVRVEPRQIGPAVVKPRKKERRRESIRQAIDRLITEAHTEDRDALREEVEQAIAAEGL